MKIKSFNDFETHLKGSTDDILGKIQILGESRDMKNSPFIHIRDLKESNGSPILICNDICTKLINESNTSESFLYNSFNMKKNSNILKKYIGENFIPKTVKKRSNVKRLKFPIVAYGLNETNTYSSLYRFKKSEMNYKMFQEKINPRTKYDALMFKKEPVTILERVNGEYKNTKVSKNLKDSLLKISSRISEAHKFDAYYIRLYESNDNKIYLGGISKCNNLNEKQANQLYMKIYEDYYKHSLPTWFKNKINSLDVNN